ATKNRTKTPGLNAQGIRSLHIQASVVTPSEPVITARLDSGADITLMSQEYWNSLPTNVRPPLRSGSKVHLQQLTCSATILGYVNTCIYVRSESEQLIQFDIEAYIVKDMQVPLLLGEDFMTTYEMGVLRKANGHCTVFISGGAIPIPASTSTSYRLGVYIRKAYIGSKALQRKQAKRARLRSPLVYLTDSPTAVTASKSLTVAPGHCSNLPIVLPDDSRESWFIESAVITEDGQDILAAPSTLLSPTMPFLPVANPSSRPLRILKGDI
ncbi:hypothetical protein PLEOSDRAFT_1013472, partial [Pleurotus ostreatus PC15]